MYVVYYRGLKFRTYDAHSYANACKRAFRYWIALKYIKNQPRQGTMGFIGVTVTRYSASAKLCWSHSN